MPDIAHDFTHGRDLHQRDIGRILLLHADQMIAGIDMVHLAGDAGGQVRQHVKPRAADIFSLYVGKGGGIGPARKIAAIAEAAGVVCTVGSNLELGIASAAMIHLAMATPSIAAELYPCDILGPFFYEGDVIAEPLPITAGSARPLDKPGLGVELDPVQIARYRVH